MLPKTEETRRGESSVRLGPGHRCGQSWGQLQRHCLSPAPGSCGGSPVRPPGSWLSCSATVCLQHQEAVGGPLCGLQAPGSLHEHLCLLCAFRVLSFREIVHKLQLPVSQVCAQHLPTAHCEKPPIPQGRTFKLSGRCLVSSFCSSLKILIYCLQTEEYWVLAGPLLPESHFNRPSRDRKAVRRWGLINFPVSD